MYSVFFFFNDTATTEIYTLSLHDALPISLACAGGDLQAEDGIAAKLEEVVVHADPLEAQNLSLERSEEHTSELQSRQYLVCRLLLEKKKKNKNRSQWDRPCRYLDQAGSIH